MHAEVTVLVYNKENDLPKCIDRLTKFLAEQKLFESSIVIADNASTDRTWELAQELEKQYANVKVLHILKKGCGLRTFEVPVEWVEDPDTRATMFGSVAEHSSELLRGRFSGIRQEI